MIEDLARITTIPVFTLKKLFNNLCFCICHKVLENYLEKNLDTCVNIGIGKLSISIIDGQILYKFIPSQKFEQILIDTIKNKQSPLVNKTEDILIDKIITTYKELL